MSGRIFKPATPFNLAVRREAWAKKWDQKFHAFKSRNDIFHGSDGRYHIRGNLEDWGSKDLKHLALDYGCVFGNFICGGFLESLRGAPELVGGNFSFHGELRSLEGFPKEVWGNVRFINHLPCEREAHAKKWTKADIKKICKVRGTIIVNKHTGL